MFLQKKCNKIQHCSYGIVAKNKKKNKWTKKRVSVNKWTKNSSPSKCIKAATGIALEKKVFLEIWQNSQESTCARDSLLIKFLAFTNEHLWTTAC